MHDDSTLFVPSNGNKMGIPQRGIYNSDEKTNKLLRVVCATFVVGSHVIFVAHHVDIQRRIIVGLFEIIL
jgi:hypothetical protein